MGKLNMNLVNQKLLEENSAGSSLGADFDKLVDGKNIRRILFPKGDADMFYVSGYVHYTCGPDKRTIVCPSTYAKRCPICEALYKLKDSTDPEEQAIYDRQKKKRRIAMNVLDMGEANPRPKVLFPPVTILKAILSTITDPDYGDITDPDEGRDVTITKSGAGLSTKYALIPKPKTTRLSNPKEIEEAMTDLQSLYTLKPDEELQSIATYIETSKNQVPVFTNPVAAQTTPSTFSPMSYSASADTNTALKILGDLANN